ARVIQLAEEPDADDGAGPPGLAAAWRALRELWARGHLSDNTPKALAYTRRRFVAACARAGGHEPILDGARRWVAAAEDGDGPRYLTPLRAWLDLNGWTKEPPPKRVRQAGGMMNGTGRSREPASVMLARAMMEA